MNALFDKWNLRPHERRLVMVIGLTFFVVLNLWFVWPHFGDWKQIRKAMEKANTSIEQYKREIARMPAHEARLRELQTAGTEVPTEEQAIQLLRTVQARARTSGVHVSKSGEARGSSRLVSLRDTAAQNEVSQFFDEQQMVISATTGNKELIDFLVSLASDDSIIRVRNFNLRTTPDQSKLLVDITFVASYQKNPPAIPAVRSRANLGTATTAKTTP